MAVFHSRFCNILVAILLIFFGLESSSTFAIKKSYIVYLGEHAHSQQEVITSFDFRHVTDVHHDFLGSFLGSKEKAKDSLFYSYNRHINGFAAILEEEDAAEIAKHPNVVSVFLDRGVKLHTTHSWDFLMLERYGSVHSTSLWKKARFGEDIIIGNLDTGVWPESESFSDAGYGPVPSRWKGSCQNDTNDGIGVPCNRKLIGARYYNKAYLANVRGIKSNSTVTNSPRDDMGHGSHTLSTAGGNFVANANAFGFGNGTVKGGSPRARVAAYKVCWPPIGGDECYMADILKGFDRAIYDGVDVVSVSLGGLSAVDYFEDGIAIGALHAVRHGIVTVCSAGNNGPFEQTATNVAPWIITVGASNIDREFQAFVELPNGRRLKGLSRSRGLPENRFYPLLSSAQAKAQNATIEDANLCKEGALDSKKVKGKILVCLRGETARLDKGKQAAAAGAIGMILCNDVDDGYAVVGDPHVLPAAHINYTDGLSLYAYLNSTKQPKGYITTPVPQLDVTPSPRMALFSSKGPNGVTPQILKPDITAPGVNIMAAYSEAKSVIDLDVGKRKSSFYIISGTSMSCPHVSGVAAILKSLHPNWSPAAIRSAIMTTARTRGNDGSPILDDFDVKATPFSYGAGHIRPNKAMDPGLVYDLSPDDYVDFVCALGYNKTMLGAFSKRHPLECPKGSVTKASLLNFNYPSITIPELAGTVSVTRTLKNVDAVPGVYSAHVREPVGFLVSVQPKTLRFAQIGEEKSFKLTIKSKTPVSHHGVKNYSFGELLWSDGKHYVRSPIVVAALH